MVLADTGGHYLEGTTDITRTIVLGPVTEKEKKYFTAVLRGNLNLAAAKFKYGCTGLNLDYLARGPLWELGEDYNHGTGHGVGYIIWRMNLASVMKILFYVRRQKKLLSGSLCVLSH